MLHWIFQAPLPLLFLLSPGACQTTPSPSPPPKPQPLPLISEPESTADMTVSQNSIVNLTCVARRSANVVWYFTDQHLPVSTYAGDSMPQQLLSAGHAYTVQPLASVGNLSDTYWALTLTVRVTEQTFGHYQCQASDGTTSTAGFKMTHDIYLRIKGSVKTDVNQTAFANCCRGAGLAEECRVFCEPWKLSASGEISATCLLQFSTKLSTCGLGSSNAARCCAHRNVPTPCLPLCQNSQATASACYNGTVLKDVFTCHAEGFVSVPGPPRDVSASLDSTKRLISVKWSEPVTNPQLVKGYSVHWKADSDVYYFSNVSMSILVGATIALPAPPQPLEPKYSVYVQSIGSQGSSLPSPIVTTVGPPVTPDVSSTPAMQCCLDKKVDSLCADRLCAGRPILDLNDIINSSCGKHLSSAFACYAGGRNHTDCCQSQGVPLAACGKFCTGESPHVDVHDTSVCLPHLDAIARCYDSGAAGIPSPPRLLVLDVITDRSVSVHWQPPLYNPGLVLNYSLLVADKVTGWRTAIASEVTEQTVVGLASDRFYELTVVAIGRLGSSLPSNRMTVMTMDAPPSSSRPAGNSGEPDMPDCCDQLTVPSNCSSHCASPRAFNPAGLSPFCKSSAALPGLLTCLTDGRNNTACCQASGVPPSCLSVCAAQSGDPPPTEHCSDALASAAACARKAYSSVPSAPTGLRVESYGTNFVDLAWQLPIRRPLGVEFRYRLMADVLVAGVMKTGVVLAQFPADVTVGHVVSLQPGGEYSFRLTAESNAGSSLQSDSVTVWLLPDLPSNWSASVNTSHLPYGITQCCSARKVPRHCQLLCDPRNMTNWNHTDSSLSAVYNNCSASLPDITSCLADGKNHEPCCRRENVPDVCLGLCSGASAPAGSLTCPLWWREIYGCIEEGILGVPSPPIIRRIDVFSSRLFVTFDRNTADDAARSILYIRFADTPSHWFAFLNPANPAVFRVHSNTSFSLFMINSNTNGSSQPSAVYTVRTLPEHPLNMYITTNASTFRVPESPNALILTCYYSWPLMAAATFHWYRSGHLLQSGQSPRYTIPHVEARDSGLYTCALQLSTGQSGSVSVPLHIQSAVVATSLTGLVPARLGQAARLTCIFEGFPDRVEWFDAAGVSVADLRDGSVRVPLFSISDLLTYSSIEFSSVTAQQLGHYTCRGVNQLGRHAAGALLYNTDDASRTTPAPPTVGPAPTGGATGDGSTSAACCATRGVSAACITICNSGTGAATISADCASAFVINASHCLADSRNFTHCCQRSSLMTPACLPLCWGDPPKPSTESCPLSVIAACLHQPDVPGPPYAVTAKPLPPTGLLVSWKPPLRNANKVVKYLVTMRVADSPAGVIQATVPNSSLNLLHRSVPASAAISVTVTALGGTDGDSLASLPASVATPGPPEKPRNLHVMSSGNNIAVIAWVFIPGATPPDSFQVNASLASGRTLSLSVPASQTQVTLRCLLPRATFYIRVRAVSAAWGDSPATEPPLQLRTGSQDPGCRGASYDYWKSGSSDGVDGGAARTFGVALLVVIALAFLLLVGCMSLMLYWRRAGVPSSVRSRLPCVLDIVDSDACRCFDGNYRSGGYVANSNGGDAGGGGVGFRATSDQLFDNPVRFDNSDGIVSFGRASDA